MGIHKYPSIESYWNNSNLYTNIISSIMPKSYYFLLAKCLHFPEKEEKDINSDIPDNNDPRGKIYFFRINYHYISKKIIYQVKILQQMNLSYILQEEIIRNFIFQ